MTRNAPINLDEDDYVTGTDHDNPLPRDVVVEVCRRITAGQDAAGLAVELDRDAGTGELLDGTRIFRTDSGAWTYPGWSQAGRSMLDRGRPDID